ncbi:MAG: hypothetical protein HY926_04750 [Elusimicrobia bacterium]|nr:hypothetical protein [Elusimicrobiota bacterium]
MPRPRPILAVVARPPEPDGAAAQRSLYSLLTRLGRCGRVQCLAEAPPLSWGTLKAALAVGGVDLQADWAAAQGDFFARVRAAVRGREFSALLVAGAGPAQRWLQPLRMLVPGRPIVCFLPDAGAPLADAARPPEGSEHDGRTRWKRLLSFADAVWVEEPADALRLHRAGLILGGGPRAVCATRRWNGRELAQALDVLGRGRRTPARSVAAATLGLDRTLAGALRRGARQVAGRVSWADEAAPASGGVAGINRVLRGLKADFLWVCAHPFRPSENLFRTLWEGMQVLPFAGGAAPVDCARKPGARPKLREDLFAAAWALGRKGDWHEVDHLSHFCCLLLRRRAVEAAGLLDERFLDPQYALIDYCLRLQQAGFPVYQARDALVFCGQSPTPARRRGAGAADPVDEEQRELLVEKWSKGSLRLMEALSTALEPQGYRVDPEVRAGFKGLST